MSTPNLTEREQQWLEHLQRADELEVTLRDYATAYNLDVKDLYYGKRQLTQKGVLSGSSSGAGDFVPVQVAPEPVTQTTVLHLQHPSGWTLACVPTGRPPSGFPPCWTVQRLHERRPASGGDAA